AGQDVADDEGGTGLGDADDPPRRGLLLVRGDLGLALLGGALVLAHHVDARADGQRHGGRDADRDESLARPETRVRGWVLAPVVHGDAPLLPFRCPCSVVSISTSPQTPTNVELPLRSEVGARVRPRVRSRPVSA